MGVMYRNARVVSSENNSFSNITPRCAGFGSLRRPAVGHGFSGKINEINVNCATHRGFGGSGGAKAGRQGKSLAVLAANLVGMIESFGESQHRGCQPFPSTELLHSDNSTP